MARNFSPETDNAHERSGERGASQRVLLLVLLLLAAVGGYLYFFTGLIKPREEVAKSAPAQPATVKMPIPPRPEQAAAKPEEKKAPPAPIPAKPAAPAKPAQSAPAQPAPAQLAPPKPAAPSAKPETAKVAKPAAPPVAKAPVPSPVAPPVKKAAKPAAPVQATTQKEVRQAAKGGRYALQVGTFVAEPSVREALAKLKKAGITPVAKVVEKKPEPMNRLFVADFSDRGEAAAELAKVKKVTGDAFMLRENGAYAVYAGSYFLAAKAAAEQDRLFDKGVKTLMKKAPVAVSVTKLTAGAFTSKAEAQKAAARLKKHGLVATVVKAG